MCNFSLDGPRPLGDPSCCRRVGTARPPHSVFPPPALMSPFHYCAAIHHAHGQGDFAGTSVCVGHVAQDIITGDKAQALALPVGAPGSHCSSSSCLGAWFCAAPASREGPGLWSSHSLASSLLPDMPVELSPSLLSFPGRLQTLTLAVSQIKDICACQILAAVSSVLIPMRNSMVKASQTPDAGSHRHRYSWSLSVMAMDQDSLHHPPPTSHRWLLYHNRDLSCHSPYQINARAAEVLYIDVIIRCGGW